MVSERRYEEMIRLLLEFTTTPGTLGVLAAHEGDNYFGFNRHGIALGIVPNKTFAGTPRMYASAVRTVVSKVETDFTVEVRLLLSFTSVGRRNALCKLVFLSSSSQMLILIRFGSLATMPQVVVLSAKQPSKVTLTLNGGTVHTMTAVADQKTDVVHSQVYSAKLPMPQADFMWRATASFASSVDSKGAGDLHYPTVGDQSVVVV
jgi:hypothetical protein